MFPVSLFPLFVRCWGFIFNICSDHVRLHILSHSCSLSLIQFTVHSLRCHNIDIRLSPSVQDGFVVALIKQISTYLKRTCNDEKSSWWTRLRNHQMDQSNEDQSEVTTLTRSRESETPERPGLSDAVVAAASRSVSSLNTPISAMTRSLPGTGKRQL